ncbi:glycosyltransferase, partial [Methylophaga sp.]|uniref:glycosyltransferase n=1 Tax=Methylophaga sp. TaxID=2024840 RepID=UPI003A95CF16
MNSLVTVLTPSYNRVDYIVDAVESVLDQTYSNIEYIVVDDGSKDGTFEILEKYNSDSRVQLLFHPGRVNKGQSASLNLGLKHAKGEYVAILDSDDIFHSEKIKRQIEFLDRYPEIGMVYGQAMTISSDGEELFPIPSNDHCEQGDPNYLLLDCYMALPGGAMVRKSLFDRVGFFEESFRAGQDHDMVVRLAEAAPFAYMKGTVFYYRKHEGSISTRGLETRWRAGFEILRRAAARYPYNRSTIRKRRALLNYRMGQVFKSQGKVWRAVQYFMLAGLGDPRRAIAVVLGREKRK